MNPSVLILLCVTLVWGTTFPLLKMASASLSGVEISGLRFLIAALCMLPFALRVPRATWRDGALLGALALVSYVAQAYGLEFISSNRSAFITSINVLLTPLILAMFFGARLSWVVLAAAALACAGIGLMSWEGGAHLVGDSVTVLCAVAYALYVIVLSQRASRHNLRQLAATQIIFMAVFSVVWIAGSSLFSEAWRTLPARAWVQWPVLVFLGVVATAGMLFLQAVGQRNVSADKAAVIFAMEPVFAALFGWLWLNEVLSGQAAVGGAMVVLAVILSEVRWGKTAPTG